jgi:hypothetical protein
MPRAEKAQAQAEDVQIRRHARPCHSRERFQVETEDRSGVFRPGPVFGLVDTARDSRATYCLPLPGDIVRCRPVLLAGVVSIYRCGAAPE